MNRPRRVSSPAPRRPIIGACCCLTLLAAAGCTLGVGQIGGGGDGQPTELGADGGPPVVEAAPVPDAGVDAPPPDGPPPPPSCDGSGGYAYLHGDLWPFWYNMRVVCDPEHRALWRCERVHGAGSPACGDPRALYQGCVADPYCVNWGVCSFTGTGSCTEPDAEHLAVCDTRALDYESDAVWGTYYGWQWGSSTTKHRFMTIKVHDAQGQRIVAFSSNPGEGDAYMGDTANHGVGPEPQGVIQIIADKYKDRFGAFACIRLPAGQPLQLQAFWMYAEFPHTCQSSYASQPHTPCRSDKISLVAEPGRHYLWTERGLEQLEGCDGSPQAVARWLPQASCSTSKGR